LKTGSTPPSRSPAANAPAYWATRCGSSLKERSPITELAG
jgi:hypothetical protein